MDHNNPTKTSNDNPGVRVPPPLIFLALLLIGLWFDSPWMSAQMAVVTPTIIGAIIAIIGFSFILRSAIKFKKAETHIEPWKPTTTLLTSELYAYSRNPIYLGMAITHAGLAICAGSITALITLGVAIYIMQTYVIAREERYLEAKFGQDYIDYKNQVRRWI